MAKKFKLERGWWYYNPDLEVEEMCVSGGLWFDGHKGLQLRVIRFSDGIKVFANIPPPAFSDAFTWGTNHYYNIEDVIKELSITRGVSLKEATDKMNQALQSRILLFHRIA